MIEANELNEPKRSCPRFGETIVDVLPRLPGRPQRWCSAKCRRAASEERRAAAAGAIATHYVQVDASLDDHVQAVLASPDACRRSWLQCVQQGDREGHEDNATRLTFEQC